MRSNILQLWRPTFRRKAQLWEVVADRWHIGFVDLTGGAGLLGQVEGRTAASVRGWIEAQRMQWRRGVQVVADRHVHRVQSRRP